MITVQFCSQLQAWELQKLGIDQNGRFFVHYFESPDIFFKVQKKGDAWLDLESGVTEVSATLSETMIRTFSVAELGILINAKKEEGVFNFAWNSFYNAASGKWTVSWLYGDKGYQPIKPLNTEAEARADFLIKLIYEKHVCVESINEILKQI